MARVGDLVVRILGETAQFQKAIKGSEAKLLDFDKTAKKVSENLTKVGKKMTTFVTLPILGIGAAFIKTAADAEEVNSKFNIVFRDQAENVRGWAEEFSQATGRATVDNIKFLASVQDLFVPLGVARDEAADLSKSVVTLATDMGSFNNLPTKDVLRDIQSALVGNHETVRKYGVVLSEATVSQELLNMGVEGGSKAATAAEKAMARYNLILAGTSDAQGDAVRTAGSFTNRFIALQSSVKDLAEGFGNLLLPTIQKMVEGITGAVRWVHDLNERQKTWLIRIAGLAAAIGPALLVLAKMISAIRILVPLIKGLNLAMLATPWAAAIIAVVALTAVIWKLADASREEKKLDSELIALKDELNKVRGEERVRIQETIVAKIRDRLVSAIVHKAELEERKDQIQHTRSGAMERQRATARIREQQETIEELTAAFNHETEELLHQLDVVKESNEQRKISLPILEEQTEKTEEQTEAVKRSFDQMRHEEEYIKQEYIPIQSKLRDGIEKTTKTYKDTTDVLALGLEPIVFQTAESILYMHDKLREQEEYINKTYIPVLSSLDQKTEDLIKTKRKWASVVASNVLPMFEALGQAMVDQAGAAEILLEAFKAMIVGILKAIGQRMAILGAMALVPIPGVFNPIGAPAAFALAAAAFVAAGVVSALQEGGITSAVTPALLHPNEAILPLDNEEAMSRIANAIANAPAPSVAMGDNLVHVTVNLGNKVLYDDITRATKDRRILIDAGAVV